MSIHQIDSDALLSEVESLILSGEAPRDFHPVLLNLDTFKALTQLALERRKSNLYQDWEGFAAFRQANKEKGVNIKRVTANANIIHQIVVTGLEGDWGSITRSLVRPVLIENMPPKFKHGWLSPLEIHDQKPFDLRYHSICLTLASMSDKSLTWVADRLVDIEIAQNTEKGEIKKRTPSKLTDTVPDTDTSDCITLQIKTLNCGGTRVEWTYRGQEGVFSSTANAFNITGKKGTVSFEAGGTRVLFTDKQ